MKRNGGIRHWLLSAATALLLVAGLGVVQAAPQGPSAQAVVGSQFDPGNIISDALFFDANAMSEVQIQQFLDSKIGACSNSNCLNVLRVTTPSEAASYSSGGDLICSGYTGVSNERASAIIFKVQQACRVSAKVILVTLQKEQGLVTKTAPTDGTLERAMGYGCPDNTGGTCASQYYGFYNQVMNGAWQLRRYGSAPVFGTYRPGLNTIKWHPNDACGTSQVNIANRATAALYNYTPYRPNAAALANLYGTGDGCSSYGNRNFWVYYNDWFGSSTFPPGTPEGNVAVTPTGGAISLAGWAVDPDAVTSVVAVSIQVDSSWYALYASGTGADRSAQYPGAGNKHDFAGSVPASPGVHTMCIYLVNAGGIGGTGTLGCQQVTVPTSPAPVGAITSATAAGRTVSFTGWAVQPDKLSSPVAVALNYGAQWTAYTADQPNSVAPTVVPGAGPNQGFSGSFTAQPGVQSFCIWAARSFGPPVQLGCRTLLVPDAAQTVSAIETATATSSAVQLTGYAVWPDAPGQSVPVAVNIGANWYGFTADKPSTTAIVAVPGSGPNHGFVASIPMGPGSYEACLWVVQPAGGAKSIGCRTVTVAGSAATRAEIQSVVATPSGATVSGWAVWPSAPASTVPIAVNVGSSWYALSADQPNPAGEAAVPGAGQNHGFTGTIPIGSGAQSVCVWVINAAGGATKVGCQTVTKPAATAVVGELVSASSGVGGIHYSGWAVLPSDPAAPVQLAINIGSSWTAIATDEPSTVAPERFTGAGPNQGYSGLIAAPIGTQSMCVWASSPGGPVNLGCRTVAVSAAPAVTGGLTSVTASAGSVAVSGWAVWPSALTTPVPIAINVGTQWTAVPSNLASSTAADYVLGAGPNQGFGGTVAAPSGQRSVCAWAAPPSGPAIMLGCSTVTVP
ncbi:MAG: hypothetical protein JWP85_2452 [Rhodoglobus sp.]|nr:hypothetical protein [Rhodoglobus sp.]